MTTPCNTCRQPAATVLHGMPHCVRCWEYDEEYDRRRAEVERSGIPWNTSRDDAWWRDWLTSMELFRIYRRIGKQYGTAIHEVAGGTVYEYGRDSPSHDIWVQIWLSEHEVIVAYPPTAERYGWVSSEEGLFEFATWIEQLRHLPALIWGRVRDRSSYGASWCEQHQRPVVKWAQCGDWAGLARNWDWSAHG